MSGIAYEQLADTELKYLHGQEGDNQAFFELYRRYRPEVLARWQRNHPALCGKYPEEFENFFDDLLKEAIPKWDQAKANFRTFFIGQVCRRRVIDFVRRLWARHRQEARTESELIHRPSGFDEDGSCEYLLDGGRPPLDYAHAFTEEDIKLFREALAREKQDCQELLRLMLYSGPKKFEEKAQVLAIMGYNKKATGWRDTWMRNRHRIVAYIEAGREES